MPTVIIRLPAMELLEKLKELWHVNTNYRLGGRSHIAACFTEPSMFVLPTGTVAIPDHAALVALLKKVFAGLEVAGFSHSEVGPVTATPCGSGLAIVDAAKVRRLKADGSLLEEIDGHYVIRETDEGWRFTVAVVCAAGWREAR